MAKFKGFKQVQSSSIVLACLLPFGLTACGSSASAPAAGHVAASTGTGTGSGTGSTEASTGSGAGTGSTGTGTTVTSTSTTADTPLGTAGNVVGTVVESTGNTVAATGASLTNGALNNPLGVTVLNTSTPGTGAGNIVDANVLSSATSSTAPVQANVLSGNQIISASVSATQTPVVSPLLSGATNTVGAIPGAGQALTTLTNGTQPVVADVGKVTGGVTAPLDPALNLTVGKTTLIGSPGTQAAINADLLTQSQLANVAVTSPSSAAAHGGLGSVTSELSTVTGGALGNLPLGNSPLGALLPK